MTKALPPPVGSRRTGRGFATFSDPADELLADDDGNPDFAAIQQSPEFRLLRKRLVRFVFPTTVAFLAWYLAYVLASAYARDLMSTRVFGLVNVGLLFGIAQFLTTIVLTLLYSRYAARKLDPQVVLVRRRAGAEE
jgi:uncharacterized membrane protein (DUF485 family)